MTHIIRPSRPGDLEALYEMAKLTGGGFTNLPPDRAALTAKLSASARAFARPADAEIGTDLFVLMLEDAETGESWAPARSSAGSGGTCRSIPIA